MKKLLLALLFVIVPSVAVGQIGPKNLITQLYAKLTAVTLDVASSTFTVTQTPNSGTYGLMNVYFSLVDADNSVTAITLTCSSSLNNNTTSYRWTDCTVAAGVATCVPLTFTVNPSGFAAPKNWQLRIDIEGLEDTSCVVTDTGGLVADTLSVSVGLAVKGG